MAYPRSGFGMVIPDPYEDNYSVVVPDADFEQVLKPQGYGDDGIKDGAEGLGVMQARALKAKLGARGRTLRVGHRPYAVGATLYGNGLGGVVEDALSLAKGLLKTPAHKIAEKQVAVLLPAVKAGNVQALAEMHRQARQAATVAAKTKFYGALESLGGSGDKPASIRPPILTPGPAWRGKDALIQAGALILPGQWEFIRTAAAPSPPSATPTMPGIPTVPPTLGPKPPPAPGPVTDAGGGIAPMLPPVPSPVPSGGGPTPTETIAAGGQVPEQSPGESQQPQRAGLFDFNFSDPKVMLTIAGIIAVLVAPRLGGKSRRRRRR